MIKHFKWSDGCRKSGDANGVGKRLEKIRRNNGGQIPVDSAIDDARDTDSPLHPYITWNVKDAARKCWRSEMREVIRSLRVCDPDEPIEERHYALHIVGEPNVYREASEVMADPEMAFKVIRQAQSEMHSAARRLDEIRGMKKFTTKIRKLAEELVSA